MTKNNKSWAEFIVALRSLDACIQDGTNKHDRVDTLIAACIENDIATFDCIVSAVTACNYHTSHVQLRIAKNTGNDPIAKRWWRDQDGQYHNHPD